MSHVYTEAEHGFFSGESLLIASPTIQMFERGHAEDVGDLAPMAAPPFHCALASG